MTDPIETINPEDSVGVSRIDQRQALIRQVLLELPPDECMEFVRAAARIELEVRAMAGKRKPGTLNRETLKVRAPDAWLMALLAQYAFNVIMEAEHERKDVSAA